jgi:hypothetical protein
MTKEDYMKLSKERLAELLAERDSKPIIPIPIGASRPGCYGGGVCTNPFHDCINCPRQSSDGIWTTNTSTNII